MKRTILCMLISCAALSGAKRDMFEALRNGDIATLKALLKSGEDPNQRNESGATALMYGAAFSSVDCVLILLDRGAEVNATGSDGSTALMWGTGNTAKVHLLLERGAAANARTKNGTTALVTSARRGNTDTVRLLIARGAEAKVTPESRVALVGIAYSNNVPGLGQVLKDAGVQFKNPAELGPIPTSLLWDVERVKEYLDWGADPNQTIDLITGKLSILAVASSAGQAATVRLLLQRGVDPNRANMRNRTALMLAATASHPDPVRYLIEKGADINAHDDTGRTALDWALTQGDTEIAGILRKAGAKPGIIPMASPKPVETPRSARQAVEKAVAVLEPIGTIFQKKSGCVSCHNNSLPEAALNIARARGIAVNPEAAAHVAPAIERIKPIFDEWMLASCSGAGFLNAATKGLFGQSEAGVPPNSITDAVTSCLASLQQPDGAWGKDRTDLRPPLSSTPIVSTALALRGLDRYSPPGLLDKTKTQIARALDFLRNATPADTQDEAFKLLGFVWAGAQPAEVSRQADSLLALQRDDGGWSQLPTMAADAYATGEALYALRSSGLSPRSAAYKKGADYLLRVQLPDGSWYVRSRAFGFQPYQEYGFPHGKDQFISAAATSWAAIALAFAL